MITGEPVEIQLTRTRLIGNRVYNPGDRIELPDSSAKRELKAGSGRPYIADDVEAASVTPNAETGDGPPKRGRKPKD